MTTPQRSRLVEEIEKMLKRRLGWNEIMMSNIMWRYIGINVDEYIAYGIDPNTWLDALYRLTAGNAYWFGLQEGDMYIRKVHQRIEIELGTTNPIDAILFAMLTKTIAIPSIYIAWIRNRITWLGVFYYLYLKYWPWYNMDYRAISGFDKDNLLKFIAGLFDSDGIIASAKENKSYYRLDVRIAACRQCEDFLTFIKDEIHEKLGIIGKVKVQRTDSILQFRGTHAVELVRYMLPHIRHPMKRLRAVLYLMYYDKELTVKDYQYLYEPLKYDDGINDPKRYRAVYVLAQAAPHYPVAWLLTYNGADCALWRYVYSKCMESELCRRLIDLLPTIGYRLEMHKCYADLDVEIEVEAEQAKPPNNVSTATTQVTNQSPLKTPQQAKHAT